MYPVVIPHTQALVPPLLVVRVEQNVQQALVRDQVVRTSRVDRRVELARVGDGVRRRGFFFFVERVAERGGRAPSAERPRAHDGDGRVAEVDRVHALEPGVAHALGETGNATPQLQDATRTRRGVNHRPQRVSVAGIFVAVLVFPAHAGEPLELQCGRVTRVLFREFRGVPVVPVRPRRQGDGFPGRHGRHRRARSSADGSWCRRS